MVVPDSCRVEACQDWDDAALEIEVIIRENWVAGVVLDDRSGLNIMVEETCKSLGLVVTNMASFTVKMVDQRRVWPVGLIRDVEVTIAGLKFATTFTVLRMESNEGNYPMLLGRPWLCMAKVKHNWANDQITICLGKHKKKVEVFKLHAPLGGIRPVCIEGVEQDEEDESLDANPTLESLFEVEVEKIKEKYLQGSAPVPPLEDDEDSLMYEEEYVLRQSKQPRRVPEDDVVEVNMGTKEEPQTVKISKLLEGKFREELISLLKKYKSVFAWSYKDMPRIDPAFYQHKMDLKTDFKPIQQQRYRMNPNYAKKVKEEIDKLL